MRSTSTGRISVSSSRPTGSPTTGRRPSRQRTASGTRRTPPPGLWCSGSPTSKSPTNRPTLRGSLRPRVDGSHADENEVGSLLVGYRPPKRTRVWETARDRAAGPPSAARRRVHPPVVVLVQDAVAGRARVAREVLLVEAGGQASAARGEHQPPARGRAV